MEKEMKEKRKIENVLTAFFLFDHKVGKERKPHGPVNVIYSKFVRKRIMARDLKATSEEYSASLTPLHDGTESSAAPWATRQQWRRIE